MTAERAAVDEQDRPRRPMRADARRNYERLVEVATESFLTKGPDASLDEIAKKAGVGPGTLYRHFPTREDLLEAVWARWSERVRADAEPLLAAQSDALATLTAWLIQVVDHVSEFRGLAAALLLQPERKHATVSVLHTTSEELVARAQAAGEVREDVTVSELMQLVSGISYSCGTAKQMKKPAPDPARLVGLIMDGIRAR